MKQGPPLREKADPDVAKAAPMGKANFLGIRISFRLKFQRKKFGTTMRLEKYYSDLNEAALRFELRNK